MSSISSHSSSGPRLIDDGAAHANAGDAPVEDGRSDHDVQVGGAIVADVADAAGVDAARFRFQAVQNFEGA